MNSSNLKRPFTWFALTSALVVLSLIACAIGGAIHNRGTPVILGWEAKPRGDSWIVTVVDDQGPAGGKLKPGDQIVTIDGSDRAARFGPPWLLRAAAVYRIDVRRNETILQFSLTPWRRPQDSWRNTCYLILAIVNFAVAVWIGLARPDYQPAQVAFFLFLATARAMAYFALTEWQLPLFGPLLWIEALASSRIWEPLGWAVAYDFALRFPEPLPQPRFLRLLRILFYLSGELLWVTAFLPALADLLDLSTRSGLLPPPFPLTQVDLWRPLAANALGAIVLLSAVPVLIRNYRVLPDPDSRRRLRWIAFGIILAGGPLIAGIPILAVLYLLGKAKGFDSVQSLLNNASLFSALAPVTFAYAIVKHRVLGLRLVIRKGFQYLLATNVLRVILWLPVIAIVLDLAMHPDNQVRDLVLNRAWWLYLLLIVSAAVSLRYRNGLQLWVDRKFFRSAYEEEAILSELIDQMQECENADAVAYRVAEKIQANLQPSSVSVLYRRGSNGPFTLGYPPGQPIGLQFRGIFNEQVQDALQAHRSARTFTEIADMLEERESISTDPLRNMLLTPVNSARGELMGVVLLGERKSEQPYSPRDRKLLQAIATQMGLVLEMLSLKEQVREEGRVRVEVLGRLDQEAIQLVLECPVCGTCYSSPSTHCEKEGAKLSLTLPIERIIDDKYRLEKRIGAGGMGAVYAASDLRLERTVAIKIMTGRLFGNNVALRRFEREARAAARLQHPNIVAIYDFGSLRGGGAYLVMQRIAGRSWRAETIRSGQIRPSRAALWVDQLCQAMACAHASGVVHRDLKPENVLVSAADDESERITVLDFGIAKLYSFEDRSEPELTSVDRVIGTYGYMSPEQRSGGTVDARSDIYSIGVMTVETLSNIRPPVTGASQEWIREALRWPRETPVTERLLQLLGRSLADVPGQRISAVEDLQRELISLLAECPPPLSATGSGAGSASTVTMP